MGVEGLSLKRATDFKPGPVQTGVVALGLISGVIYLLNFKLERFMPEFLHLSGIYMYLGMALVLNALYLVGARLVFKHLPRMGRSRTLVMVIICFGTLFRAVLVPEDPALLSTDMYRYVWDGRVQQQGINPYLHAPSSEQLKPLRDELVYPQINRKESPTVYPAGAQLLFRVFHILVGDSVPGFKGLMVFFELLTMWVLVLTLRAYGFEEARVFIYAWSPLVVFEIGYGGHIDGLTVFFTVLAFYLNAKKRKTPAVIALAFSSATKLYPALLLPALLGRGERIKGVSVFFAACLLLYIPFLHIGGKVLGFLPNYFSSPYESFNLGLKYLIMDLHPGLDYLLISKVFAFALMAAGLFVFYREKQDVQVIRCAYILVGLLIVLMPTALHPWYVVILVPFLSFFPSVAWLAFTGLLSLSYIYYAPSMGILPLWVSLLEYLPLFVILATGLALELYRLGRTSGGVTTRFGANCK